MGAAAGEHDAGVHLELPFDLGHVVEVPDRVLRHDVGPPLDVREHRHGVDAEGAAELLASELDEVTISAAVCRPDGDPEELVTLGRATRKTWPRTG